MDDVLSKLGATSATGDIEKADILRLLEVGLKENRAFAKHFADTVLSDIQNKIKKLKIETTAIQIDGKGISKDINDQIRSDLEKEVQKTVSKTKQSIKSAADAAEKDISPKKSPLSISSLLGQTPQMSMLTQMQYQGLTRSIIEKIRKGLPEKFDVGQAGGINLSNIFAPPKDNIYPLQGASVAWKFNRLKNSILDKIKPPKKNIVLDGSNLNLSSIFAPPGDNIYPLQGASVAWKFNNLKNSILDKIKPPKKNIYVDEKNLNLSSIFAPPGDNIYPLQGASVAWKLNSLKNTIIDKIKPPKKNIYLDEKNLNLSSLFAPPGDNIYPLQGLVFALKWNSLRRQLLDKIKLPKKIEFGEKSLSIDAIMGTPPEAGILTRLSWYKLRSKLLGKIGESVEAIEPIKKSKKKSKSESSEDDMAHDFISRPGQKVQKFSSKDTILGVKELSSLAGKDKDKGFKSLEEKTPTVEISGFTKDAVKDLETIPGLKSIGKSSVDVKVKQEKEGIIPGWLKLIGGAGIALIAGGLATVTSGFFDSGPFKGLKKMLGTMAIQLGTVFTAFFVNKAGKIFHKFFMGMVDNLVGVLGKVFPKAAESIGKLGGKIGGGILKIAGKSFGSMLKPLLKKLPLIGTVISFAYAFSRFKSGDFLGGLLDVASGLASLIPGIGTVLSIGIDIISAFRDTKTSKEEKAKEGGSAGIGIFKLISSLAIKMGVKFGKFLKFIPGLGSILSFVDAFRMFKQGQFIKGLLSLTSGIAGFIPGVGTALSIGIDIINSFIKPQQGKSEDSKAGSGGKSIFGVLKDWIADKVKLVFKPFILFGTGISNIFKGNIKTGFKDLAKSLIYMSPVVGMLFDYVSKWISAPNETKEVGATTAPSKSVWESIKGYIVDKFTKVFKRLISIGSGLKSLFTGKFTDGFRKLAEATAGIPIIGSAFGTINRWIGESKEEQAGQEAAGKPVSIFGAFKKMIFEKIKKGLSKLPWWLKKVLKFIPGLKSIIEEGKEGGEQEMPDNASKANSKAAEEPPANDFIWRRGQKPQRFSKDDNIIGVKSPFLFKKLLDVLQGKKQEAAAAGGGTDNKQLIQAISALQSEMRNLATQLHNTTDALAIMSNNSGGRKSASGSKPTEDLAGVSDSAGDTRDPAWTLRARAWDRIRKGYVVI